MVAGTLLGPQRIGMLAAVILALGATGSARAAAVPVSSGLVSVSCLSPSWCTAVATSILPSRPDRSVIAGEHWNGRRWAIQHMPSPGVATLTSISCTARDACTAVGLYARGGVTRRLTLAERWNGRRWAMQPTPSPAGSDELAAVSCSGPRTCVAVGFRLTPSAHSATLAERWNGHAWSIMRTANPRGTVFDFLSAVSCSSPTACTAVGAAAGAAGANRALIERWNGRRWTIEPSPHPAGASALNGVACSSATTCTAVGSAVPRVGATVPRTLAEGWNGRRWRIQATPAVVGFAPLLLGVSCSAPNACTAVGTRGPALAERWNGSRWTIETSPRLRGAADLASVSCTAASACTAVGVSGPARAELPLAEGWNGRRWARQSTPTPG